MEFLNLNFSEFLKKTPRLVLGVFSFFLLITANIWSTTSLPFKKDPLKPIPFMERMSFGYQEVMADLLWIRSIQDFDYCDQQSTKNVCKNESWLYWMLDSVTNLSPHFRIPYAAGALALTVIISDIDGATKIFDKGVQAFPKDWPILYRAAYHYLYEVKDKKRAAELLIQAGQNGAPKWVFTLAGRLYSDEGQLDLAKSLLNEMIQTNQDAQLIKRLREKINSMNNLSTAQNK